MLYRESAENDAWRNRSNIRLLIFSLFLKDRFWPKYAFGTDAAHKIQGIAFEFAWTAKVGPRSAFTVAILAAAFSGCATLYRTFFR